MDKIWIGVVHNIKHGGQNYYAGERRFVDRELGEYFAQHGWAQTGDNLASLSIEPVTLKVQDGQHGQTATSPGVN